MRTTKSSSNTPTYSTITLPQTQHSEYICYKSLQESDSPIDSNENEEQERTSSHSQPWETIYTHSNAEKKLIVNHEYITPLLNSWLSHSMGAHPWKCSHDLKIVTHRRKQLFIDLDDTLIYTSSVQGPCDIESTCGKFVSIRPFAVLFLKELYQHFDIIVCS